MKREDFIFTIGYQGSTAVVDGKARKKYGALSAMELAEHGLYRAAFCAALYDRDPVQTSHLITDLRQAGFSASTEDELKRLFGIYPVEGITKTLVV